MSRPKNPVPVYKKHPTRDEARCWVGGRWISLGKYNTDASRKEYERVCSDVRTSAIQGMAVGPSRRRETIEGMYGHFLRFAITHYRTADGTPTSELRMYRDAVAPLRELYGDTYAADFGPLALQAVRQKMIDRGWCRTVINKNISRIRRLFKWAASQELVPQWLPHGLACVQGLQRGRTTAREMEPVTPVPATVVDALLPTLVPTLRAMVELQRFTGMRPGEVRLLRPCDVDRSGELWIYKPDQHKTAHRGKERVIVFGPRARAVFEPWLAKTEPTARCFTPMNAKNERYEALRAKRKSKVPPSQMNRRKPVEKLQNVAGDEFTDSGYAGMVTRAAVRAGLPAFHPHQLRHTFASEVRHRFGLEAAQVLLGHSKADVTQIYATRDLGLATKVASEVG